MPYYVNTHGELWEYDDPAQAQAAGLSPATDADLDRHDAAVKNRPSDSFLGSVGETLQDAGTAALGTVYEGIDVIAEPVAEAFGYGEQHAATRARQRGLAQDAAERSPTAAQIGRDVPAFAGGALAAAAAAPAAAALGAGALVAGGAGVLAGGATSGIGREFSDAWFQERPAELERMADNVLLDTVFSGGLKALGAGAGAAKQALKGGLLKGGNAVERAAARAAKNPGSAPLGRIGYAEGRSRQLAAIESLTSSDKAALTQNAADLYRVASYPATDALNDVVGAVRVAGYGESKAVKKALLGLQAHGVVKQRVVSQQGLLKAMAADATDDAAKAVERFMAAVDNAPGKVKSAEHGVWNEVAAPALDQFQRDWGAARLVTAARGAGKGGKTAAVAGEVIGATAGSLMSGGLLGGFAGRAVGAGLAAGAKALPRRVARGTTASEVMDEALQRFARHPAMQNPEATAQLGKLTKRTLQEYGAAPAAVEGRKLSGRLAPLARATGAALFDDRSPPDDGVATYQGGQGSIPRMEQSAARELGIQRSLKALAELHRAQAARRARPLLGGAPVRGRGALDRTLKKGRGLQTVSDVLRHSRKMIREFQASPQGMVDDVAATIGDVNATHPGLHSALSAKIVGVLGYLNQQLPPPVGKSLSAPDGYPPTFEKAHAYAQKVAGATDPAGTLNDLAAGRATPLQVAAFRATWPGLYSQQLEELALYMGESGAAADASPERTRYLDQVLGLDGAINSAQSWTVAAQFERARNIELQKPSRAPRETTTGESLADNFATRRGARRMQRT